MAKKAKKETAGGGKAMLKELLARYTGDFIKMWNQFYGMFEEGIVEEHVSEEREQEFLRLKAHLIQVVQVLNEANEGGVSFYARSIAIITDAPCMELLHTDSPVKLNDMRAQWNEVLIAANRLLGGLRDAVNEDV